MPRLPRVTGMEALAALQLAGWRVSRRRGSHVLLRRAEGGALVVVPVHSGTVLKPKTLRSILEQAELAVDDFVRLL